MKNIVILLLIMIPSLLFSKYVSEESMYIINDLCDANKLLECSMYIDSTCYKISKKDPNFHYITTTQTITLSKLSFESIDNNKWDEMLDYTERAYKWLKKDEKAVCEEYPKLKSSLLERLIIGYHKTKKYSEAKPYKTEMGEILKNDELKEIYEDYYVIDMFKQGEYAVNVYESIYELGDKETEGSFSKLKYVVFRFDKEKNEYCYDFEVHILKFHKFGDSSIKFDYIMHVRKFTEKGMIDQMQFHFYSKKLDYQKIDMDVHTVLDDMFKSREKDEKKQETPENSETKN